MQYLIHTCPKRKWYVDEYLIPSMQDQGIHRQDMQIAEAFLQYCQVSGYEAGIYCNVNWYNNYIDKSLKQKYKFWIARYGKNDGTLKEQYKPNIGEVMWQYTSKGKVDGIPGYVDMDVKC